MAKKIPLTDFQLELARLFFSLPASDGFLLAGGAALVAQRLTSRPTQDLDFFTGSEADVPIARDELTTAVRARGWTVRSIRESGSFCRLQVTGPEDVLVDIALDARPGRPPTMSVAGPTFAPQELAARKVVALYDRFVARDFVDIYTLTQTYGKQELLTWAAEVDPGFDRRYFIEALDKLSRYSDVDLALSDVQVGALRRFFSEWAEELRQICE